MEFLEYGDEPRYACPLRAWPQYSRVGAEISEGGGAHAWLRMEAEADRLAKKDEDDMLAILSTFVRLT